MVSKITSLSSLGRSVLTRRRFVTGLSGAAVTTASAWASPVRAQQNDPDPAVLTSDRFDLAVGALPVNITGRSKRATVVNGSMPGPTLRFREGETVTINVTNHLNEPTSIHWHGLRLPADQDGVPGLTFPGIMPGETFTYRFPIIQSGTYWYHSHSGMQEQTGLSGALILEPQSKEPYQYDRDYVIVLSDWTDEDPITIISNLKQQSDYYNFHQRTLGTFFDDVHRLGFKAAWRDRAMWGRMRMSPTDIMDVTGATYTFLVNGQPPAANWTALFRPGERIRLRVINSAAMSTFDVRIPGLSMTVVAADGNDIEPVVVDEFRIGVAETYDMIVQPQDDGAYTIFAQAQDRSGYARATLAARPGLSAAAPPLDVPALRSMADMGMSMAEMVKNGMDMSAMDMSAMDMSEMDQGHVPARPAENASGVDPGTLKGRTSVDNVAVETSNRLGEAGNGLDGNGRRVLVYNDLKALKPDEDPREPARDIEFHLTGNMERWVWGFDGKKFSEAPPVQIKLGERVRFILINDTMMEHPIHLHGFLFSVENDHAGCLPLKHTINVKPAERVSVVFTADTPGNWAFHCHLLYHMETGMFRTVVVA
ncbi:MAG: copper resistance system multicopper oxidase [Rhodospirillaceae bacterium]|nr:MAG: copper resistance system multicopper oxidase [Rhodospirillaceae bacterium]